MIEEKDMKDKYIESLLWRLDELTLEISTKQKEVKDLFSLIKNKQEQANHLITLLAAEGHILDEPDLSILGQAAIPDLVYEYLDSQEKQNSIHYKKLAHEIISKGTIIPGQNPSANLLSQINRDDRFVRTAPGTYGLKKWGMQPYSIRKKPKRKRKT
mgnify:CR=1 FL=1